MPKVESISVPLVTQCITLKTISFTFIRDPQLCTVSPLETNGLLVDRDNSPTLPCRHTNPFIHSRKGLTFQFGYSDDDGFGFIGSCTNKNLKKCLWRHVAFGPKQVFTKSLPFILSSTCDLNFIVTDGDGDKPCTKYIPICFRSSSGSNGV